MGLFSKINRSFGPKSLSKISKMPYKALEKGLKSMGLGGSKAKLKKVDVLDSKQKHMLHDMLKRFNPKALDIMKNPLYKQGQSYLQNFLKQTPEQRFAPFEKQAMSQFNQQIVPDIAERFSALGAQGSSAFNQSMAGAGANLAERLAMLKEGLKSDFESKQLNATQMGMNYAQQPVSNMFNLAGMGLGTPSFGYQNQPSQPSFFQSMAPAAGQAAMMLPFLL